MTASRSRSHGAFPERHAGPWTRRTAASHGTDWCRPTGQVTSIVVAIDGRDTGWAALEWAAREASRRDCPLHVVHVFTWPGVEADRHGLVVTKQWDEHAYAAAEVLLGDSVNRTRQVATDLRLTTHADAGSVPKALARIAAEGALVVLGQSRLVSRVASVRMSSCWLATRRYGGQLAIISRAASPSVTQPQPKIAVAITRAPVPVGALEFAFSTARLHGARLAFVSRPPRRSHDVTWRSELTLQECLPSWKAAFPDVDVVEHAATAPLRSALARERADAMMVIIGRGSGVGLLASVPE